MHFRKFFDFFGNPSKVEFLGVSSFLIELPKFKIHLHFISKKYFWGNFLYFEFVSLYFWSIVLKLLKFQFVDRFPQIFDQFPHIFWSVSAFFWIRFRFFQKLKKSRFVDQFPQILGPFPLFFDLFLLFSKVCFLNKNKLLLS